MKIQAIFEYYCLETKAASFDLERFINDLNPNNKKLSFKNYPIDDLTAKALVLTIPYMHEIKEFEANSNKLSDQLSGALLMAIFVNPSIRGISIGYNFLRGCFCATLAKLIAMQPDKLKILNTMGSIAFVDSMVPIIRSLKLTTNIQ